VEAVAVHTQQPKIIPQPEATAVRVMEVAVRQTMAVQAVTDRVPAPEVGRAQDLAAEREAVVQAVEVPEAQAVQAVQEVAAQPRQV